MPATHSMISHVEDGIFAKVCLCCHRAFRSNSRNTRFCSPEVCQPKFQTAKTKRRKEYAANAEAHRIWVRAHELSRLVLAEEVRQGRRIRQCELNKIDSKDLQVHHKDGNHLNASPDNLSFLTPDSHCKAESALKKGVQYSEWLTNAQVDLAAKEVVAETLAAL